MPIIEPRPWPYDGPEGRARLTGSLDVGEPAGPGSAAETCCDEPDCRRHYPVSLYLADFSGRVFAVTKRRVVAEHEDGTATFAASERHDVTRQLREFARRNPEFVRALLDPETAP
jgi:hypothetical protein